MTGLLELWWVWAAFALILAILEVFAPGYIFLGFAVGAGLTSLAMLAGGPLAAMLTGSLAMLVVFFAAASLAAWLLMRASFGGKGSQVREVERDINQD